MLTALHPNLEPLTVADQHAPVRAAYRYIENRPDQLDYQTAIAADLPIGSGEIESAHRYVILERLDIAGAWWTVEKAEELLSRSCPTRKSSVGRLLDQFYSTGCLTRLSLLITPHHPSN